MLSGMWDELSVERSVTDDELATAVAQALGVDRERLAVVATMADAPPDRIVLEKRPYAGDFALRVGFYGVPAALDRAAFYRALARLLATRLLADDGELDPYTAMLVMPGGEAVRVRLDPAALDGDDQALVIAGLHMHVDTDEVPDRLVLERTTRTRGAALAGALLDLEPAAQRPPSDVVVDAYTPAVQDAHHALAERLRELVHRGATPDDERVLRRTCAVLRRAFPRPAEAGLGIAELLTCADGVLAARWDPDAPA